MSDLAATNCGCDCGCGCDSGCSTGCGCNNNCGCNNSCGTSLFGNGGNSCSCILWIICLYYSVAAAAEQVLSVIMAVAVAMTAAGSSSFFCFCAEMDAAATIAADLLKRQRSFPLPFLLPFFCLLLFLFFLFQTFQIYLIKSISIYNKHFFLFF